MRTAYKKNTCRNLDRISELPEPIILDVMSRLPLQDAARASILSKTWKNFCCLYPILYFDHNAFELQSRVSTEEGGRGPDYDKMRDMFMDNVDYHLMGATQLNSPIRKITLILTINDSAPFSRIDTWLETVRQLNVEDLCFVLQSYINNEPVRYEFPVSILGLKGLRSVSVEDCNLVCDTSVPDDLASRRGVSFSCLQSLSLLDVYMNTDVLEYLTRFCQGLKTLDLFSCNIDIEVLKLSKFPNLKKAVIDTSTSELKRVDIVDTKLEYLKLDCDREIEINMSPEACAGIRELSLKCRCIVNQPNLFKDLTATFHILEELDLDISELDLNISEFGSLKATSNALRKIHFDCYKLAQEEIYIDCPNLTYLSCTAACTTQRYVDCPKLKQFHYHSTVPERLFFRATDLEVSECDFTMSDAPDTLLWFSNLRVLLEHITGTTTNVVLNFWLPVATFKREELEAVQAPPKSYSVPLEIMNYEDNIEDKEDTAAAIVDAMLWIIRPTVLKVSCNTLYLVKYLCENLVKKSRDNVCDEQVTKPCWMHPLVDFQVKSPLNVPVLKEDLANLPKECIALRRHILFKFQWS